MHGATAAPMKYSSLIAIVTLMILLGGTIGWASGISKENNFMHDIVVAKIEELTTRIHTDNARLQTDIGGLKESIARLQTDMGNVKEKLLELQTTIVATKTEVDFHAGSLAAVLQIMGFSKTFEKPAE